jgi:hypothetical protein
MRVSDRKHLRTIAARNTPVPRTGQETQAAAGGKYYSFFPFFRHGFLA